ncbi:MAG: aspartate kinase [Chloroflexi bacterium]|nr:aspartate kinase [Chloroflexota bacterium]
MPIIVQKYGGSSLADAEKVRGVARRIIAAKAKGDDIVVVCSAMGDSTDDLLALSRQVAATPVEREVDLLLSTGEMVSCALLAMALNDMDCPAVSLTGLQAGIQTEALHGKARIADVAPERIQAELEAGKVAVVCGFQGVTEAQEVTTLGRGGSDTTAVALAAALKAERCAIYTDVEGIYTADPRIVPKARKLAEIGYEEMLELAVSGAKMQPRSIELGELYDIPILVASTFSDAPGTLIHREVAMEVRNRVRGVASDTNVAKVTVLAVPDKPGIAATFFEQLTDAAVSVDTIVQNTSVEKLSDLSFTVDRTELAKALAVVEPIALKIGAGGVTQDAALAKVSVVGTGMQNSPGYASTMFRALADAGVNIEMISTSEIRITCIVSESQCADAVRALHKAFELDQD